MWNTIWQWATDNYAFHTVIVGMFLYFICSGKVWQLVKKIKKFKAGPAGIEVENIDSDIDPKTPCPYTKSRDITFGELRNVNEKVDALAKQVDERIDTLAQQVQEVIAIVKNMSIDQQKQLFYDLNQPDAERLAGGLKYIFQGGNGHTKGDVIAFAEQHRDIYNALTYIKPELRLIHAQQ